MNISSSIKTVLATVALGVALSGSAFAFGSIYDNGAPNQQSGNEMTNWLQSEDFSLASDSTLKGVEFWTIEEPGAAYDGTVQWTIFGYDENSPAVPGTILGTGVVNPTKVATGASYEGYLYEYDYTFNTTDVSLTAGTIYHLGLHANTSGHYQTRDEIYWETTDLNNTIVGVESNSGTMDNWNFNDHEHAFKLYGTPVAPVPEPSSMLLLLPGLGCLGALIRRRK